MQDKVVNYAKYVREMYWPEVSEKKKNEIQSLLDGIRSSNQIRKSASNYNKYGPLSSHISKGRGREIDEEGMLREIESTP